MWKENSGNLLQTAAILLSLNLLLVGRMLVKQSRKTLVCHSFLLLLCLDCGSNVQTVVNLPMERAMWSPPEPARAHSPQRSDIFGQLSLQAMSVYICESGLVGGHRNWVQPRQITELWVIEQLFDLLVSVQCVLHQHVTDTQWSYTFQ